jgi:hypothetical protein
VFAFELVLVGNVVCCSAAGRVAWTTSMSDPVAENRLAPVKAPEPARAATNR